VFTSLAVVLVALLLPFTPLGTMLGFAPLPLLFFVVLVPLVATYLLAVEAVKRWFYRRQPNNSPGGPLKEKASST
jgi:Mg2+-importing ATPase